MKTQLHYYLTPLFICFSFLLNAQISFTNSNHLLPKADFHSGVGVGIADMNEDGLNDIIRLDDGYEVNIELQIKGNTLYKNNNIGNINNSSVWSVAIADLNNDGKGDILGGYNGGASIFLSTDSNYVKQELDGNFFAQTANFADINNDGTLDIFVCDDDGESQIYTDYGTGKYLPADDWIDMSVNGSSGEEASGNYGSIWTDFDNDGDLDLYIAKCRGGVNDPTDSRRINVLYVNDGNGNYTEMGEEYGLRIGWQSWTADFQDIDNDGDLDCFITNHDVPSQILENDGTGHFTDITDLTNLNVTVLPIEGIMRDFDNDGFVDILVAGSNHQLFKNNGNKTFTEITDEVFDGKDMESYGVGDVNQDGFIDVYASYAEIYTTPTKVDDILWLNEKNDNHFLTVHLRGKDSNRNGVGARLEIYGEWGIQVREVRSGESYGISNCLSPNFGLGMATMVDSLIVKWPSGIIDQYNNIAADQFITVIEGECIAPDASLADLETSILCDGESMELVAPEGYSYEWSNGEMSQSIMAGEEALYRVTITDQNGCTGVSPSVDIIVSPDETPTIVILGESKICDGDYATLISPPSSSFLWTTGDTTESIQVTESGFYSLIIQGTCESFSAEPVQIEVLPEVTPPITQNDTIGVAGELAYLIADSEDTEWFVSPVFLNPIFIGDTFEIAVNETTVFYTQNTSIIEGETLFGGLADSLGDGGKGGDSFFEYLNFNADKSFILKSVKVYAYSAGTRAFQVVDNTFQQIGYANINVPEGESRVTLNFEIPAEGEYYIGIGNASNPDLYRDYSEDTPLDYPFSLGEFGEISGTSLGDNFYYYFYDWEVKGEDFICHSELTPVEVVLNETTSTPDLVQGEMTILPNPNNGQFRITLAEQIGNNFELNIRDFNGQLLKSEKKGSATLGMELDLRSWPKGVYIVQLKGLDKVFFDKIVIQ